MELSGMVKSFNPHKGWGFVECNGQDMFLHKKNLKGVCPTKGDQVQFTVGQSATGAVAENVKVVTAEEAYYYGKIKSYNPVKGFGFITSEAFPKDIFLVWHQLPGGFGAEGSLCRFSIFHTEKGPAAKKVMLLGAASHFIQMQWMMGGGFYGFGTGFRKGSSDKTCWDLKKNSTCKRAAEGRCCWEPCNGVKNEACSK